MAGHFFPPNNGGSADGVLVPAAGKVPKAYGDTFINGNWLGRKVKQVWVSPSGDNANNGTELAPFKTIAKGYQAVFSGGGIVNFEDGSHWTDGTEPSGDWGTPLTAGQGMRLTLATDTRPGWWHFGDSVLFRGLSSFQDQFGIIGQAKIVAGNTDNSGPAWVRGDPAFWTDFIDGNAQFENAYFGPGRCPVRLGWDYARTTGGDVNPMACSSATRTGSAGAAGGVPASTVFTISSVPTYNIISLSRAGGLTTATLATGTNQNPQVNVGSSAPCRIVSSDPNFPTGNYVIAGTSPTAGVITYVDASSPSTATAGAVGTFASHGLGANDRVTFYDSSHSAQFPDTSTSLKVTASTQTTVTVIDWYGGFDGRTDGTFANPGNLITEIRSQYGYANMDWYNCSAWTIAGTGSGGGGVGPAWDLGINSGFPLNLELFNGRSVAGATGMRNPDEGAYMLCDGAAYGTGISLVKGRISNGNIRVYVQDGRGQYAACDDILQDSGTGTIPPCFQLVANPTPSGGGAIQVRLNQISNADDADSDTTGVQLIPRLTSSNITVTNCTSVNGGLEGGPFTGYAVYIPGQTGPAALGAVMFDGNRVIAHQDTARRATPFNAGNVNRNFLDINISNWTSSGIITVTSGQAHPDGVSTAFKISGSGSLKAKKYDGTPLDRAHIAISVGDQFVLGYWVALGATGSNYNFQPITVNASGISVSTRSGEWQWVSQVLNPELPDFLNMDLNANSGADYLIRDPVLIYIPVASAISVNELADIALHLGPSDSNLLPGTVGTGRSQVFQAQGRVLENKGSDVSSASTITLLTGNLTKVTGTTTTKYITTTGWQAGSRVFLSLASGITITNNAGSVPASAASILLRTGSDLTTAAAYLLELVYDGTNWVQPG